MNALRKFCQVLATIGVLLLFASPLILGALAGFIVYLFLGPETFWERTVAFLVSLVVFLLAFSGVATVLLKLSD